MNWRDHFRRATKLTNHAALARDIEIEPDKLSAWLGGKPGRGKPDIEHAIALAKAMHMSLDELFRGAVRDDKLMTYAQELILQAQERGRLEAEQAAEEARIRKAEALRLHEAASKSRSSKKTGGRK